MRSNVAASLRSSLREGVVEPGLPAPLDRFRVRPVLEQVDAHANRHPERVAAEEAVQGLARPDADEVRAQVVDDALEGLQAVLLDAHGVALGHAVVDAEGPPQPVEAARPGSISFGNSQVALPGPVAMASQTSSGVAGSSTSRRISNSRDIVTSP